MKKTRFLTYKKISRLAYTLGTLFLLVGLMLSMVNQPVSAGSPAAPRPTSQPGEVDPPVRNPQNPAQPGQPPVRPGPAQPPARSEDAPSAANRPGVVQDDSAIQVIRPLLKGLRPGILAAEGSINFVESNTPLCQIEPGWITAHLRVTLASASDVAEVGFSYYIANPDDPTLPPAGQLQPHQLTYYTVQNGETLALDAWWPGIRPTDDKVEIHWAATLYINDVPISDLGAGLDYWYDRSDANMPCGVVTPTPLPALSVNHLCDTADQTIDWTVTNPGATAVDFTWSLDDGDETGSATAPAGQTVTFHTSPAGLHSMNITWNNGVGGTATASHAAEDCLTLTAPAIGRTCAADGIHWSLTNPNPVAMTVGWSVSPDGLSGSVDLDPGETLEVVTTPGGAHTLTASYPGGSLSQSSNEGECTASLALVASCSEQAITWTVNNTGTAPASLTWSLDAGTGGSGGGVVPAGGSLPLTTASDDSAHQMLVTWAGGTLSSNTVVDHCSVPVPDPLTITKACTVDGIVWTVHNPRNTPVAIDWSLSPDDETGSGTVPANGSLNVTTTPGGAHTLDVTWDGGEDSLSSLEGECTPVVTLSPLCNNTTDQIDWTLYNMGDVAVEVNWNLDDNAQSGSVTLNPDTSLVVAHTPDTSAHQMLVTWAGGSLSSATVAGVCGGVQIQPLRLRAVCAAGAANQMQWQVVNPNESDVVFNWFLDGEASFGSAVAAGGATTNITRSALGTHEMVIEWDGGSASQRATITSCQSVTPTPTVTPTTPVTTTPALTYLQTCSTAQGTATFYLNNPGATPITVDWSLDGGAQTGSLTIPPHTRVEVVSLTAATAHTLRVTYPTGGGTGVLEVTSPACTQTTPQTVNLRLAFECGSIDSLLWTVTNPGSAAVSFTWTLDGGAQTGSDSVPANGSRQFLVTSAAVAHTVVIRWANSAGTQLSASVSSAASACGVPTIALQQQPTATAINIPETGATPVAMQPPASAAQGVVIQPVTGGSALANPLWSGSFWQTLFQTLGLLLFGIALVFHGLSRNEEE